MGLEFVEPRDESLDRPIDVGARLVAGLGETEVLGDLEVAPPRLRPVVLREGGLLHRIVDRVVAHDVGDQQGVRQAMRNVEGRAELVRHRVAHAEEGVGEGDAGDGRAVMHLLPRHGVGRAFACRPPAGAP